MKRKAKLSAIVVVAAITAAFFIGRVSVSDGHTNGNYIPVEDIACQYTAASGYTAVELKDFTRQNDDVKGKLYTDILKNVPDETEEYNETMLDLDSITDVQVTDDQVIITGNEGNSYILDVD